MDWQLCLKPASVRPQDLCELNVNAALEMLCKSTERMDAWLREKEKKRGGKSRGRRENGDTDPRRKHNERLNLFPTRLGFVN